MNPKIGLLGTNMVGFRPLRTFPTSGGRRYFVRDDTAGHEAAAGGGPQVGRGNAVLLVSCALVGAPRGGGCGF
jgi:hypothetical protein